MEDPYEGSIPINNRIHSYTDEDVPVKILKAISTETEHKRKWTYANCWYMGETESNLMWKAYSHNDKEAVVIQSTYKILHNCLPENVPIHDQYKGVIMNRNINLGIVNYIDYDRELIPIDVPLSPFMYKRNYFKDEKELRVLMSDEPAAYGIDNPHNIGVEVKVNLNYLIKKIYVSPIAEDWFMGLIKNITKKYISNRRFSVKRSRMGGEPVF